MNNLLIFSFFTAVIMLAAMRMTGLPVLHSAEMAEHSLLFYRPAYLEMRKQAGRHAPMFYTVIVQ